jgi:putative N6-adenine-specific DNA methylase
MCGSGTFPIEAAEQAAGLFPGRSRSFAFEKLASFDHGKWDQLKQSAKTRQVLGQFFGFDRDMGAIRLSQDNANRAAVGDMIQFQHAAISDLEPPDAPAGIVIINPPYGGRIGERKMLFSLYGAMGQTLKTRFKGWKIGILTTDGGLAKATGLPFLPSLPPVPHGGKRVTLHRTDPL